MSLRFRRSVRIAKGVRLNFSKSGVGISAGPRGMKVGIGPRGAYRSIGIPGTGIYDFEYLSKGQSKAAKGLQQTPAQSSGKAIPIPPEAKISSAFIWLFIVSIVAIFIWPGVGLIGLIGSAILYVNSYKSPGAQAYRLIAAGNRSLTLGDNKAALQTFISVTELIPEATSIYKILGELSLAQDDFDNAVFAFDQYFSRDSGDYLTKFTYAAALSETDRYKEAIPILQGFPPEIKDNVIVITLLGSLFLKDKQPELALSVLENGPIRKRKMDVGILEFRYALATAYKETGDKKRALREFRKVYAEDMNYIDVQEQLSALEDGNTI